MRECEEKIKKEEKLSGLFRNPFLNRPDKGTSSSSDKQQSKPQERSETTLNNYETVTVCSNGKHILEEVLEKFAETNKGIMRLNKCYSPYHYEHLKKSKQEIRQTAKVALDRIPQGQPKKALLLGVGNCLDIPLQELAEQFGHLTLVELDHKSTKNAIEQLPPELQKKITLVVEDITGSVGEYCQKIHELISATSSAKDFFKSASTIIDNIVEKSTKNTLDVRNDYAFVCSQLVLSQLCSLSGLYVQDAVKQKFGVLLPSTPGGENDKFFRSCQNLTTNLQQEHIRCLAKSVSPLGTVHLADTYKQLLYSSSKKVPDEKNMVIPCIINPVIEENFRSTKKATKWSFHHTPEALFFDVVSHSLEPKLDNAKEKRK